MGKVLNVLLGLKNNKGCALIAKSIQSKEFASLFVNGYKLGNVDSTTDRKELDECIESKKYDVALLLEQIEDSSIGPGTIKKWREINPDCRIVLVMDQKKKCSIKTNTLYNAGYYDGVFTSDVNIVVLAELFMHGREEESAFSYYGLEDFVIPDKEKARLEEKARAEHDKAVIESIEIATNEETVEYMEQDRDDDETFQEEIVEGETEQVEESSVVEYEEVLSEDVVEFEDVMGLSLNNEPEGNLALEESSVEFFHYETIDGTTNEEDEFVEGQEESYDSEFFEEERAQFSSTTQTKTKSPSRNASLIYKATPSKGRRSLDQILKTDASMQGYLAKKEKEIVSRQKRREKKASRLDICFDVAFQSFSAQYGVAFDELAMGKMNWGGFDQKLYPYIESLSATASEKSEVLENFRAFTMGYDVLEPLLNDPGVTDIHVLDAQHVRVKKEGKRCDTSVFFYGEGRYDRFCSQLLLRNRDRFSSDGTTKVFTDEAYSEDFLVQVSITEGEVSTSRNIEINIRKTLKNKLSFAQLIEQGRMSPVQAASILYGIGSDKGIIICGPTSVGKTTIMNAMLDHIPDTKNGIVIQYRDELIAGTHPELSIQHPIVETDTRNGVDFVSLAKDALLLDVDYIIFGDIKGSEAEQFYIGATSGYVVWGCVTSVSAEDALRKIAMYAQNQGSNVLQILIDKIGLVVFIDEWDIKHVYSIEGIDVSGDIRFKEV